MIARAPLLACMLACESASAPVDASLEGSTDGAAAPDALDAALEDAPMDARDGAMDAGPCGDYCLSIAGACSGAAQQYFGLTGCVAMCGVFTADGGLACRAAHLALAQGDASAECPRAGPYAAGACGAECDAFCSLYEAQCGAFTDAGSCASACTAITRAQKPFLRVTSGDTLECREYHLVTAYLVGDKSGQGHCAHASLSGGGVCR